MVRRRPEHGVVYLWMLLLVFLLGLGLGKSLEAYARVAQREREAELIQVGKEYREAIRQFYLSSPGTVRRYPERLTDLLKDPRSLTTRRYLRQLYRDPLTGGEFIPIMAPQGGIHGVRSASERRPIRQMVAQEDIEVMRSDFPTYSAWQFIYVEHDDE